MRDETVEQVLGLKTTLEMFGTRRTSFQSSGLASNVPDVLGGFRPSPRTPQS